MTIIVLAAAGDWATGTDAHGGTRMFASTLGGTYSVSRTTFNDPTVSPWVITKWSGWHNPVKRTAFKAHAGRHGSAVGPGWLGGRIITLEGHVPVSSDADRAAKERVLGGMYRAGTDSTDPEPVWLVVTETGVDKKFVAGVIGELQITAQPGLMRFVIEFWCPYPLKMNATPEAPLAVTSTAALTYSGNTGYRWWLSVAAGSAVTATVWSDYSTSNIGGSVLDLRSTAAITVDLRSHLATIGGADPNPVKWRAGAFTASWGVNYAQGWTWQSGTRTINLARRVVTPWRSRCGGRRHLRRTLGVSSRPSTAAPPSASASTNRDKVRSLWMTWGSGGRHSCGT